MAPLTTPAVLLRTHDYGDTSRILRFFTLERGLLGVLARGVRGSSGRGRTSTRVFSSGSLTAWVKPQRDLHTLKDWACHNARPGLGGHTLRFGGAALAAEIVAAHAQEEPQPELYRALEAGLDWIEGEEESSLPGACLGAAWRLVVAFGFAPELGCCVVCGTRIGEDEGVVRFDLPAGGLRCTGCSEGHGGPRLGPGARAQLRGMLGAAPLEAVTHPRRHLSLLADFVAYHLASRSLRALPFLNDALPEER